MSSTLEAKTWISRLYHWIANVPWKGQLFWLIGIVVVLYILWVQRAYSLYYGIVAQPHLTIVFLFALIFRHHLRRLLRYLNNMTLSRQQKITLAVVLLLPSAVFIGMVEARHFRTEAIRQEQMRLKQRLMAISLTHPEVFEFHQQYPWYKMWKYGTYEGNWYVLWGDGWGGLHVTIDKETEEVLSVKWYVG
jgi:hypothetical protein